MIVRSVAVRNLRGLEPYVNELSLVHWLNRRKLEFHAPITILTGDNGAGKSTLMEAIALALDFDATGGPRHGYTSRNAPLKTGTESKLSRNLVVDTPPGLIAGGFFLRAETQFDAVIHADMPEARAGRLNMDEGQTLADRSHGQAVFEMLSEFGRDGIVLLDEPEAGLSTIRQMALLARIIDAADNGTQFIIATHSPVLICTPGADVWEINEAGLMHIDAEDTENVQAMREFLDDPEGSARIILYGEE